MNKLKMFFTSIVLMAIVFAMIVVVALIYSATNRSQIKSYVFQMGNYPSERVGELQALQNMSPDNLRNKLIKKYISEYFKVIPGDTGVLNRPVLRLLSDYTSSVFADWQSGEATKITEMSAKRMFRIVSIANGDIAPYNKTTNSDENSSKMYYAVRYNTLTWKDSNIMGTEPVVEPGILYIEIEFEPKIRQTMEGKPLDVRQYLQEGGDPSCLFRFRVSNIRGRLI